MRVAVGVGVDFCCGGWTMAEAVDDGLRTGNGATRSDVSYLATSCSGDPRSARRHVANEPQSVWPKCVRFCSPTNAMNAKCLRIPKLICGLDPAGRAAAADMESALNERRCVLRDEATVSTEGQSTR